MSWVVGRRLRLIFAGISTADTPGVPFDLSQCGVERGVRPLLYAGHSFPGVALRMDHAALSASRQLRCLPPLPLHSLERDLDLLRRFRSW